MLNFKLYWSSGPYQRVSIELVTSKSLDTSYWNLCKTTQDNEVFLLREVVLLNIKNILLHV